MERKITEKLIKWQTAKNRKPLLLEGARQVGKTYIVKRFGEEHFKNYIRVDFQKPPKEIAEVFERTLDPKEIIRTLEIYHNTKIDPENTLIFFDEVQDSPRVITSLKYFCEDVPEYHVIASGSLLGVFLKSSVGSPFPVGKVDRLRLEPMDFEEFIWSQSRSDLADQSRRQQPEDQTLDSLLYNYFKEYMIVGGMPEAVANWSEKHDFSRLEEIHQEILGDYRHDFSKYTDNSTAHRLLQIFETLPKQFAKSSDKFLYGIVREGARGREYELAVEWLANAGVVRRVRKVECGDKIPLRAYTDSNSFKLYFLDIGLFRALAGIPPRVILEKDAIFNEFNGFFAEQFVLQNLTQYELFYWTGRMAEVDFVFQDNVAARIIPIEVKSGENVKAKSLRTYRDKFNPDLSLRLSLKPYHYDDGLLNCPLYKIFSLDEFVARY